jgi:hypothetical protein
MDMSDGNVSMGDADAKCEHAGACRKLSAARASTSTSTEAAASIGRGAAKPAQLGVVITDSGLSSASGIQAA